jgi:hypothetical protein
VLVVATVPASAVDYAKIERRLTKEPAYKSGSPKYALLLFGREAKLRAWLALDGEAAYLDRNGDGDLTGERERFAKLSDCKDIEIADPDGKTRYVITSIGAYHPKEGQPQASLSVNVDIKGPVEYRQYGDTELRDTPTKAAVAHFHGPLTVGPRTIAWKVPPRLALKTGDDPTDLTALIGTMNAEHGCWVVTRTHSYSGKKEIAVFPPGVHPVVEIEFPPKRPGAAPVKRRYELDQFC